MSRPGCRGNTSLDTDAMILLVVEAFSFASWLFYILNTTSTLWISSITVDHYIISNRLPSFPTIPSSRYVHQWGEGLHA